VWWQYPAEADAATFDVARVSAYGGSLEVLARGLNGSTFLDASTTSASRHLLQPPGGAYSVRVTSQSGQGAWGALTALSALPSRQPLVFAAPNGMSAASLCVAAAPCANISDALVAAAAGGALVLLPGTYQGSSNRELSMAGKNVAVLGLAGPAATVQDCGGAGRGWLFVSGESAAGGAALRGFSLVNGRAYSGGGLLFAHSSAAVSQLAVTSCVADAAGDLPPGLKAVAGMGGAIFMQNSSASFTDVTLTDNFASYPGGGGAVHAEGAGSVGSFTRCVMTGNGVYPPHGGKGGALNLLQDASPQLVDVIIADNTAQANGGLGGGIWCDTGVRLCAPRHASRSRRASCRRRPAWSM
jgi:hypothetical protein